MKNGIRRRLVTLFVIAAAIEISLTLVISYSMWASSDSLSKSYNSNVLLQEFEDLAGQVYEDLEAYMHLKSYDNINEYFRDKANLERMVGSMNNKPSAGAMVMSEYTVCCFTKTFLDFADSAVYQRRSGDTVVAMDSFHQAGKAYSYLSDSIAKLNKFYFTDNVLRFSEIRDVVSKVSVSSIVVVFFVSLIIEIIMAIFVTSITHPLTEISETANKLAERNFDIPLFTYKNKDEIGNICRAFNRMIISIREYIDTIWEKAIRENELREKEMKMNELYQEAKLNALQSQINPHFLFNTLNTGAQLAMMEGSDRTCDFLEKVADFYRYNLQYTGHESELGNEIALLESYVYIMKVRFGERFSYSTEILSTRLNVPIPGMILQPLVENCIKHGFSQMQKGGKIVLRVEDQGENVVISVSDNGIGFPEEKRINLLTGFSDKNDDAVVNSTDKDSGTGVGLRNVLNRLKMFYKSSEVFDIRRSPMGGTSFVITISEKGGDRAEAQQL